MFCTFCTQTICLYILEPRWLSKLHVPLQFEKRPLFKSRDAACPTFLVWLRRWMLVTNTEKSGVVTCFPRRTVPCPAPLTTEKTYGLETLGEVLKHSGNPAYHVSRGQNKLFPLALSAQSPGYQGQANHLSSLLKSAPSTTFPRVTK